MIIIADSGSTKTDWRLMVSESEARSYVTAGLNPYFLNSDQIFNELDKELVPFISNNKIRAVFFYGAGCASPEKAGVVEEALREIFPHADNYIYSDLLGAAKALCNGTPGFAAILGTGSNSCFFDGDQIVNNIPSLGYILGDEGSGSYIGKNLLKQILSETAPLNIIELFHKSFTQQKVEILNNIYNKPFPNRFLASFVSFVSENINDPFIIKIVRDSFNDFFEQNIKRYINYKDFPIHFTGSVAFYFQEILREIAADKEISIGKIIKSPIDELIACHNMDWKKYSSLHYYEHD